MRRRTFEELNSPERIARLMMNMNASYAPKVIRNYIRHHYVVDMVDFLADVANGEVKQSVVRADGSVVVVDVPISVRANCAKAIVEFATIGANVHHLGDDNESAQAVIGLPMLDLTNAQRRQHHGTMPTMSVGEQLTSTANTSVSEKLYTIPAPGFEDEPVPNGHGVPHHANGNGNGNHG